ncbi:hypothetical protein ACFQGT_08775 [Natrialbaceae archaeon GCM10025810]|uniref:hypothetical protein n=1 Tax=Halovalidus salilacus TaxID=3075124 RepID=UPI00360F6C75
MANLNEEMADVHEEIESVRDLLREEIPKQFEFGVRVGNISYDPNNNSVSVRVDPSSEARDELSERMGGVRVKTDGSMEFEFMLSQHSDEREKL